MWSHQNIKQVLLDLSLKVTESPFNGVGDTYKLENADWKHDIGLDSIEIMQLASYVNSFFNVFEMNNAPYLLSYLKVDEWVDHIYNGKQIANETITFNTSGTTGIPKTIRHTTAFLNREIEFLATIFKGASIIIPLIPSYSIYGFLTTIGLPSKLKIPLLYPSEAKWRVLPSNSLIVATPFHWNLLISSFSSKTRCFGISSTSPMYTDLYKSITAKGILLTELYGSTETAGVAYRQHWQASFKLFPYWKFFNEENNIEIEDCETHRYFTLADNIKKDGIDTFSITGRKDNRVKIAGLLTDLEHIKKVIEEMPGIKECSINAKSIENEIVLHAEITLDDMLNNDEPAIKQQIRSILRPHETPRIINFNYKRSKTSNSNPKNEI